MLDRVREAMFAKLMPWLTGAQVLDLFAGSGALGLEALSRGACAVRLVERDPAALTAVRGNVQALGAAAEVHVARADALSAKSWGEARYDVVFLDPPYALVEDARTRRSVFAALRRLVDGHLATDGVLVLHVPRRLLTAEDFPSDLALELREYGSTALWYVMRSGPGER